jgi:hypothetical protein
MRLLMLVFCLFLLSGCAPAPVPEPEERLRIDIEAPGVDVKVRENQVDINDTHIEWKQKEK